MDRLVCSRILGCTLVAWLGAVIVAGQAEDSKKQSDVTILAVEIQIHDGLKDVINAGADLYNRELDRAACYRLYQGSLLTLRPLLSRHPDLQKAIDTGLRTAETQPLMGQKAFSLREVLDKIRARLKPVGAAADASATLWERLGSDKGVKVIVHQFLAACAKNPKVRFDRGGKYRLDAEAIEKLEQHIVDLLSDAVGGPRKYRGRSMKEVHAGMRITKAEYDAMVEELRRVLVEREVKSRDIQTVLKLIESMYNDIIESK